MSINVRVAAGECDCGRRERSPTYIAEENVLFVLLRDRLTMRCGIEGVGKILRRRGDLELVKLLQDRLIAVHLCNLHCIFVA
jgi:hypothetical protein